MTMGHGIMMRYWEDGMWLIQWWKKCICGVHTIIALIIQLSILIVMAKDLEYILKPKDLDMSLSLQGAGKETTVYTYGRYGNIDWNKSSSATSAHSGEGVLIIMKGEEAQKYIQKETNKMEARVYEVPDGSDEKVDKYFKNLFDSSDKRPSKGNNSNNENARVIDKYDLFENNCTTKSVEAINIGTEGKLNLESTSPSNLDTQLYYENKKENSRVRKITFNELYNEYFK